MLQRLDLDPAETNRIEQLFGWIGTDTADQVQKNSHETMLVDTTTNSSLEVIQSKMIHRPSRTFTVYCVRHGEALHNVAEKTAKRRVLEECVARGLAANDPETKRLAEEARKQVLRDPAFFDATMTELGKEEARRARAKIKEFVASGLPAPEQVITSPLQRCLTTVEQVFPESDDPVNVRVEEDLRERLTGRPADNRMNSETLGELFPRFDFEKLRSRSSSNLRSLLMDSERAYSLAESEVSDDQSVASRSASTDDGSVSSISQRGGLYSMGSLPSASMMMNNASCMNARVEIEDDSALRKRAFKFFQLLDDSESDSVAVVTHKGFLRGLERGCFGITESPEFKNCEVRVYKIEMTPGNLFLDSIERLR